MMTDNGKEAISVCDPALGDIYSVSVGVKVQLDYPHEPEGPVEQAKRNAIQKEVDEQVGLMMVRPEVVGAILAAIGIGVAT